VGARVRGSADALHDQEAQLDMAVDGMDRLETTPLAERAREAILSAILSERFDGDRLPSEDELGKMLNVSRTTIRTALHSLERDGIITRRRAVGTTINRHVGPDMLALQRLVGFDWLLREKGHEVRVDSSWLRGPAPAEFASKFRLEGGTDCCLLEKLYFAGDDLAIYVRDLVPWSEIGRDLDEEVPPSLFEFSTTYCGQPIDHAVVDLAPMVKHDDAGTKLQVEDGLPYMRLHERHFSSARTPIAFSIIDVDDRFIRFEVFRRER
jgi:GntR family transcriptional regulator